MLGPACRLLLLGSLLISGAHPCDAQPPAMAPEAPVAVVGSVPAASEYRVRTWRVEQGLPHNSVECLHQAADGWLWVGTRDGLARFDGIQFTVFNGNTPGFTSDAILGLAEGGDGTLWAATKRGAYSLRDGTFTHLTTRQGLPADDVRSLRADREGAVWFATSAGVSRFRRGAINPFPFTPAEDRSSGSANRPPQVHAIEATGSGPIRVGAGDGVYLLTVADGLYRKEPGLPDAGRDSPAEVVRALLEDGAGRRWTATDDELLRAAGTNIVRYRLPALALDNRVRRIREDRATNVWVVHSGALFRVRGDTLERAELKLGLSDDYVTDLLEDREGTLWVGTRYGGLHQFWRPRIQVLTTREGLPHNAVNAVSAARAGGIWVGTRGGIARWREGSFRSVAVRGVTNISDCQFVLEDRSGEVWISATLQGLWSRSEALLGRLPTTSIEDYQDAQIFSLSGLFRCVPEGADLAASIVNRTPTLHTTMLEDRARRLWVGGPGVLGCVLTNEISSVRLPDGTEATPFRRRRSHRWWFTRDRTTLDIPGEAYTFTERGWLRETRDRRDAYDPRVPWPDEIGRDAPCPPGFRLPVYHVRCFAEDPDGVLWLGLHGGGLCRVTGGALEIFNATHGLADDVVQTLCVDRHGVLWVGTRRGLSRVERSPAVKVTSLTSRHGLPDDDIHQILEDRAGDLWIASRAGLLRTDRGHLERVLAGRDSSVSGLVLGDSDGLLSTGTSGYSQPAGAVDEAGRVWFATGHGLARIDPNTAARPVRPPEVFVVQLQTDGPRLTTPVGATEIAPVRLEPGSGRRLSLHFTALNYLAPERVRFRYQLGGVDPQPAETGDRVAHYTNLKPGRYDFRVTACNGDGVWNPTGAQLGFTIAPQFHQTWWFRLASLAGAGLALAAAYRLRVNAVRNQQRREITDLLHDQLAGRLSAIVKAASGTSPGQAPDHPSQRAALVDLARGALWTLRQAISITDPHIDTLESTVSDWIRTAEDLLTPLGTSLRLDIPLNFPKRRIGHRVRANSALVVSEALNNVVRHARASVVQLRVRADPARLEVEIEDDGRGFTVASSGQCCGRGLASMRTRAGALSGTLEIHSSPGQGTRVRLSVPLRRIGQADER